MLNRFQLSNVLQEQILKYNQKKIQIQTLISPLEQFKVHEIVSLLGNKTDNKQV